MIKTFAMAGSLALALMAGSAQAAVSVFGGGMAEACSQAALKGESELRYQKLCTEALETEFLNSRDRAGTLVNRGVLKLRNRAYSDASEDFDRAVTAKPDLGEAYVNRGAASIGQRRYAESLPDLNRALELGVSEPAKAYFNRALAHEGMDDLKSAYLDYRKAEEIQPEWDAPRKELDRFTVSRP